MAASTTTQQRPAAPATTKMPAGASKMARTYLDGKGLPQKSPHPVPVDGDDRRTAHELFQCPHLRNINGGGKERCSEKQWLLPDEKARFCPDHGKQLERDEKGPSKLEQTLVAARQMHGRSAAPWLIPLVGVAGDGLLHLAGVSALETAASIPVLAGGAYYLTKRTLTRRAVEKKRIEKGQRDGKRYEALVRRARVAALQGAEAGAWLTGLAAVDPTSRVGVVVAAAGMVRWAVGAHAWWADADTRRTRGEVKVHTPQAVPVSAPDPVHLRAVTTWKTLIGCPGGPLAGTELVEFVRLPNCEVGAATRTRLPNWSAKVVATVQGSINMRESRPNLLGRVAAAYGCTYADVSFNADEADLSVAWLRVQPDNPLAEVRMWPGLGATDWKRGVSEIGRFDDGRPVHYQWWNGEGAAHDLIGGCSGSGKSELVAQLILTSLHSNGLVLDWVGDPQGGQSYGHLKDHVDWFARDASEIKLMLLAALKEMYRRNDRLSEAYTKTWAPTVDEPLLVITLDEVQSYINDDTDILEMVEKLVGMGRKCGIKLRLITQITAAYNLGGSTYIKEQLKIGQTFVFRAMTDVAARSASEGDSPIDATQLPIRWGKNTCAAGETTAGLLFLEGLNGRDVYGRAYYTGKKMDVWLVDEKGQSTLTPGRFGPEAVTESGVLWGDRKERARRLIAAGRSDADLLSGGKALDLIEQAAVAAVTQQVIRTPPPGQAPLPDRARDVVLAAARESADGNGLVEKGAIAAGAKGKVADTTRDKALTDLVADGDLIRVKNGLYQVPGLAKAKQLDIAEAAQ